MVILHYSVHKFIIKQKKYTVMVWNLSNENPDLKISRVIMLGSRQTSPPRLSLSEGLSISSQGIDLALPEYPVSAAEQLFALIAAIILFML